MTRAAKDHVGSSSKAWGTSGQSPNLTPRDEKGQHELSNDRNWDSIQRELRTSLERKRAEHAERSEELEQLHEQLRRTGDELDQISRALDEVNDFRERNVR